MVGTCTEFFIINFNAIMLIKSYDAPDWIRLKVVVYRRKLDG